jgi:hypothetical protein
VKSRGIPGFWKAYRGLPPEIKESARAAYRKFQENPAHPSLRLERLRSDPRFWSIRVTRNYRAVAQRIESDHWVWIWIGNHTEFDRQFPA